MSSIRSASAHVVTRTYDRTYFNAAMRWNSRRIVLICLETVDGLTGWGECWCLDQSAEGLVRFLESDVLPQVLGVRVENRREWHERLWHAVNLGGRFGMLSAALSGIDIALWDLAAREKAEPLYRLLGNSAQPVPVYAAGGLYQDDSGEDVVNELCGYLELGFRSVKMKLGARNFAADVDRLSRARSAIGSHTGLIVDMTYSLDWERAFRWIPILSDAVLAGIQSPFPVWEWGLMQRFARTINVPVLGLEAESRREVFRHLLEIGALGILQFSPTAAGGFTGALGLVQEARRAGRQVSLQCSTSAISYAACLHLAAACGQHIRDVECNMIHDTLYECLPESALKPADGQVLPPQGPGLGIEPGRQLGSPTVSLSL